MITDSDVVIVIPVRLASTRLPNKPLADIAGKTMIEHVYQRAKESGVGDIVVACAEQEIADVVCAAGGIAVLTDPGLPSGTDRIHQALVNLGRDYRYIVNVQGDLPTLDPHLIQECIKTLIDQDADIATLVSPIVEPSEIDNPNVVKAVISFKDKKNTTGKALYFTRATAPYGEGELYHHIGMYAYTRHALHQFVALPQSQLEKREKLEQLRALEHDMNIAVRVVDAVPLGVDTQEDLDKVRRVLTS